MELTMLGTGNALVTECYNTCFVISDDGGHFMVDGGGGNTILRQLAHAGFNWMDMRAIFVTHKHVDHIMGIIWMMRMICQYMNQGDYEGEATIYSHDEVIDILHWAAGRLLQEKETRFIGKRLHLVTVCDGQVRTIGGKKVTFFDLGSTKTKQFGFCMSLPGGGKLTCCGDEPCSVNSYAYARGSDWLLHEAFCLSADADIWHPHEKHHSTVKDACKLAEKLKVKNLLLYHTEDRHLERRKELYAAEGSRYYYGRLFIPDDLERVQL